MFKKAIFFLLICNSYIGFGQTEEKSEIIISEEHLISLINKVRAQRDLNNAEKNISVSEKTTFKTSTIGSSFQSKSVEKNATVDLSNVNSKLLQLEYDLKYVTSLLENSKSKTLKESELLIVNNSVPYTTSNNNDYEILYKMQNEIDSLKMGSISKVAIKANSIDAKEIEKNKASVAKMKALEKEIELLKTKISNNNKIVSVNSTNLISKKDTLYIKDDADLNYNKLVRLYSNFTEKIYFNNNSNELTNTKKIDDLITLLENNKGLDVYLKGFASNKGKASYNQELSFKRTEEIKRYLIENGVHPTRILTQFHGIDYCTTNDSEARRVEATFIIRK